MPLATILLFFIVIALLAVVVAVLKLKGATGGTAESGAYELRKSIFTPAERSFLGVLESSLPDGVGILAKVRLGDIFKTKKGLTPSDRTRANNRVNQKHVDFLLVRTSDLAPVAGVELDDSSHDREDRQQRDAFVDSVFKSAGLPLLHIPAQATYNAAELRAQLTGLLTKSTSSPVIPT